MLRVYRRGGQSVNSECQRDVVKISTGLKELNKFVKAARFYRSCGSISDDKKGKRRVQFK